MSEETIEREVSYNKIPNWFSKLIVKHYLINGEWPDVFGKMPREWIDHWGVLMIADPDCDAEAFVSEPYWITTKSMKQILEICEKMKVEAVIGGRSEHYPNHTLRVIIMIRKDHEYFQR